ncbi:type I methionyl aminopeptidase [Albibacterium sp.]|uniref:type I methionyl aminopeptidase n=1 Tax=Albibacterium sp. TaxID=2952885 RepID=UPI002B7ACF10|nr:type I methionyl aminopeptidase [Albibacterium sp.]HUH17819.1 type I methionyl aminopeptidase [Albibacterium sp.]
MSKVIFKTKEQIELIRQSCDLLSRTLGELAKEIKPGVRTIDLDKLAFEFIQDHGGTPAFLNYSGFPYSLCISMNDQIVHGFPSDYVLKDGDIISVDGGVTLNGYISDSAYTFAVGEVSEEIKNLLNVTKESLRLGIEQAVSGKRVGDISFAIQNYIDQYGYGIVKELVGHGVGVELHEKPEVPNYGRRGMGPKLVEGMVIAIEPMVNLGKSGVKFWDDGWTVSTIDGKISAHYEHTVAISKGKPDILTSFSYIEDILNEKH